MGKHIYGIVGTSEEIELGRLGISGKDDVVFTIPHRDIGALVSSSPSLVYESVSKETLVHYLARHQAVIEGMMRNCTVIPMKFGTTARDKEEVQEILDGGYRQFKDALERMNGKIELDVVALWSNLDSILKEVGGEEKIKKLKERIAGGTPRNTLSAKIELGRMVKSLLDERRDKVGSEIIDELKKWSIDFRNHEVLDDTMIMNTAFLVNKNQEENFDAAINYLNKRYQEKTNFRVIGPLSPYSFITLELKRIEFEKMRSAARVLDLDEETTLSEVKKVYRSLTRKFHPDRNAEDPDAQERFEKISKAYHTLLDYYSADKCSSKGKKTKDLIVVKVLETPKDYDRDSVI